MLLEDHMTTWVGFSHHKSPACLVWWSDLAEEQNKVEVKVENKNNDSLFLPCYHVNAPHVGIM